jgi:hypothetical protein
LDIGGSGLQALYGAPALAARLGKILKCRFKSVKLFRHGGALERQPK